MKSKTKAEPTLRERAAALAVMASEVLLMVLEDPVEAAAPAAKAAKSKTAKTPKPAGKPRGRKPMTPEQRVAAKAERERLAELGMDQIAKDVMAEVTSSRAKPQPVTRESLAARSALGPAEPPSYFTKAN